MTSPIERVNFAPEPDIHPLYPTAPGVSRLLSATSGLTPAQRSTLVSHCMTRACVFADLSFLQYILHDSQAHAFLDLNFQDEDGLVFASVIILGFSQDSDRDVEREECVRLLIAEGADMTIPDKGMCMLLHYLSRRSLMPLVSRMDTTSSRILVSSSDPHITLAHSWMLSAFCDKPEYDSTRHRDSLRSHTWAGGRCFISGGSYAR